jgi:hypothetical protein
MIDTLLVLFLFQHLTFGDTGGLDLHQFGKTSTVVSNGGKSQEIIGIESPPNIA